MIHPSLESWQIACKMMQAERSRFRSYLQWYPFDRMSDVDWEIVASERFFDKYISDGAFVLVEQMRFVTKGYIQKQGATLRESYLVSPIMYLYLLAFGVEYESIYVEKRREGACLYAGDIHQRQGHYRKSYKVFRDAVKHCAEKYDYCLKTDISNFFGSINTETLIAEMQEYSDSSFSASDALFIRSVLLYCGKGKFPTIQNHPTLSFLSTKVYLSKIDQRLAAKLHSFSFVDSFCLVRYVDDLYIFFKPENDADMIKVKHGIVNLYADLLRDRNLTLKQEKLSLMSSDEVMASTAQVSVVDFSGNSADEDFAFRHEQLEQLFLDIARAIEGPEYTIEEFNAAVARNFTFRETTVTPITAFRQCLYKHPSLFKEQSVIDALLSALSKGNVVLAYNTNDMVQSLLKTRNEGLIKQMLNNLFVSSRSGSWCSLDSLAAVTYLQQRGMMHAQLIELLEEHDAGLALYCKEICKRKASEPRCSEEEEFLINLLKNDHPSKIEYISYLHNKEAMNLFEMASYYRSFFDRVSTYFDKKKGKKANSWVFGLNELKSIYRGVADADAILDKAERIRRQNPLIHAGGEITTRPTYAAELEEVVTDLQSILSALISSRA